MKVLFITEDRVPIHKGDRYFSVKVKEYITPWLKRQTPLWSIVGPYINPKATEPTGDIKHFSTREAAQAFVDKNKV